MQGRDMVSIIWTVHAAGMAMDSVPPTGSHNVMQCMGLVGRVGLLGYLVFEIESGF